MQQLELDLGMLNTVIEVDPCESRDIRVAIEGLINAAIMWAYCPHTGGYDSLDRPDGYVECAVSMEDTCEALRQCVDNLIYVGSERWVDEDTIHTVMDLPNIQLRM